MAPRKKSSKRAPARGAAPKKKTAAKPLTRKVRPGFISHTELASADPAATKAWCQAALGWKFGPSMAIPGGEYHMWTFGNDTGGGIRMNNPPEGPGSIPYVEVPDMKAAVAKATKAGATVMMPPDQIPGTTAWIAIVRAPGGVAFGYWAPK